MSEMWSLAKLMLKTAFVYIVALVLYVLVWQALVSGFIPLSFSSSSTSSFSSSASSNQTLTVSAEAEMVVYRYGFLPVYWSRIGSLVVYHEAFFSLLTVGLIAVLALKCKGSSGYRLVFSPSGLPEPKILKPETSIPKYGDEQMPKDDEEDHSGLRLVFSHKPKNDKKAKPYSRIILTVWAFIGFLWFLIYQLLPVLPYDASLVLIELLNYAMWIMVFASAGMLALPYFKVLYLKIWEEGGEKHE
jgi:hypothetical protein